MNMNHSFKLITNFLLLSTLAACSNNGGDKNSKTDASDSCVAHELEGDFALVAELGEMGDPDKWPALPPNAIVATTYLRLQNTAESQTTFGELMGPIQGLLMAPDSGLMGLSFTSSASCNTTRTLSVWESEEAMMKFVVSEAHLSAIGRVAEVSRGGSITEKWKVSDFDKMSWEAVVAKLDNHSGPQY